MTGKPDPEEHSSLSSLASVVYSQLTVTDVLQLVVELATQTLPEMIGASVTVRVQAAKGFETVTASSAVVRDLDELQYGGRGGPCVDAIVTGAETLGLVSKGRYPQFDEAATHAGVGFVRSLPLMVEGNAIGALHLYSAHSDRPEQDGPSGAGTLAAHAAIALSNAVAWDKVRVTDGRLSRALTSRGVIGQAQGILMARERIGPDEAFDILRRASQRTNRKLRDIAAEVVAQAGTLPSSQLDPDANR